MKLLYLDTFAGISGDMFLGLLLDLGVPLAALEEQLQRLPLQGYRLEVGRELRLGVEGTRLEVVCDAGEQPHRRWAEIDALLADCGLDAPVAALARRVFRRIGEAEAKIHGVALETIHFHEVGAVDSIVDIVGAAAGLAWLAPEQILCTPLPLSRGFVSTAHGTFPLPAPATLELLRGCPVVDGQATVELVTPTGAALVAELAAFEPAPPMTVQRIGYGVGSRQLDDRPNLLRGVLAETQGDWAAECDRVTLLESHLDDANPEWLGDLLPRLLAAGALDVGYSPLQMKKNRPGLRLTLVAPPERAASLARLLLRETSAIGVRRSETWRWKLRREPRTVTTPLGEAQVKLLFDGAELLRITPEYDSCRQLAEATGRPLPEVYRLVERAADAALHSERS